MSLSKWFLTAMFNKQRVMKSSNLQNHLFLASYSMNFENSHNQPPTNLYCLSYWNCRSLNPQKRPEHVPTVENVWSERAPTSLLKNNAWPNIGHLASYGQSINYLPVLRVCTFSERPCYLRYDHDFCISDFLSSDWFPISSDIFLGNSHWPYHGFSWSVTATFFLFSVTVGDSLSRNC